MMIEAYSSSSIASIKKALYYRALYKFLIGLCLFVLWWLLSDTKLPKDVSQQIFGSDLPRDGT
jgi:hypothetical protein